MAIAFARMASGMLVHHKGPEAKLLLPFLGFCKAKFLLAFAGPHLPVALSALDWLDFMEASCNRGFEVSVTNESPS